MKKLPMRVLRFKKWNWIDQPLQQELHQIFPNVYLAGKNLLNEQFS